MNVITLTGQLIAHPIQKGEGKTRRCVFRIVTDAGYKRRKTNETTHVVVVWGKRGDACAKYLTNREWVSVTGRQENNVFPDPQTGEVRHNSQVVANSVEFLGLVKSDNPDDHPGKGPRPETPVVPAGDEQIDDGWDYYDPEEVD